MGIVFVLSFYQKSIFTVLVWSLGGPASHDSASLTSLIPWLLSCVRFRTSSTGGLTPPSTTCHLHLFACLFVSPSRLSLLIDGQWTSTKSDCTHSIRRGLGRRLRSSLLLNSSPRCDPPCRIVY